MSNPLWKAGMKAVNPAGRPKHSVSTVAGKVERFINRNITPNKLQKMFNTLTEKEKLAMLTELLPYVVAKKPPGALDESLINDLYEKMQELTKKSIAV